MNDNTQDGMDAGGSMVSLLNRSEIDQQVATAHRFPRSVKRFLDEAMQMVTLNEAIANDCIYAIPRDGKTIEGPSARMAEVILSAWGNSRAGARVIDDRGDFVVAQGVFHDLERNVAITYEVQRRITGANGKRYKPDMIGVTANAACSIALRNAVLKGVPKAFWGSIYEAARATVMGDIKTLANRRADAVAAFQKFGVSADKICAKLEVAGIEDIGLEHLVTLRGLLTAIKEGDTTPEDAFSTGGPAAQAQTQRAEPKPYADDQFVKNLPAWRTAIDAGKRTADEIIAMASTKGVLSPEQIAQIKGEAPKTEYAPPADAEQAAQTDDLPPPPEGGSEPNPYWDGATGGTQA